uniref:Uncharacterized protein n=1 Tax=Oryza rufipogon TaxID=4529 RepID=A0A0E0QZ24_ORYRU
MRDSTATAARAKFFSIRLRSRAPRSSSSRVLLLCWSRGLPHTTSSPVAVGAEVVPFRLRHYRTAPLPPPPPPWRRVLLQLPLEPCSTLLLACIAAAAGALSVAGAEAPPPLPLPSKLRSSHPATPLQSTAALNGAELWQAAALWRSAVVTSRRGNRATRSEQQEIRPSLHEGHQTTRGKQQQLAEQAVFVLLRKGVSPKYVVMIPESKATQEPKKFCHEAVVFLESLLLHKKKSVAVDSRITLNLEKISRLLGHFVAATSTVDHMNLCGHTVGPVGPIYISLVIILASSSHYTATL